MKLKIKIIASLLAVVMITLILSGCTHGRTRSLKSTTHITHYSDDKYISPKHGFYNAKDGALSYGFGCTYHYEVFHHTIRGQAHNLILIKHEYFHRKFNSKHAKHQYLYDGTGSDNRNLIGQTNHTSHDADNVFKEKIIQYVPKHVPLAVKKVQ